MKTSLLILPSLFFLQHISAQVSGVVMSTTQPVPYANVALLKSSDSSFIKATVTDKAGSFRFQKVSKGNFKLQVSSAGYHSFNSAVFSITDSASLIILDKIILHEDAKQLSAVIVRSEKPLIQQKPEGIVVNVENSLLTKGSSALDVLERSPGVIINHRDNSIELNGKSGVMIMLNGKAMRISMEELVTLLNGMSADDIATIELLTTPPAKYDAEGSAGLINIVLKKNKKQGTNGAASVTTGYGQKEKATASVNLSHKAKNINLSGSYTFSHSRPYTDMYVASSQNMPFLNGDVYVTGWFNTRALSNNHDASFNLEVNPDTKTSIGASVNFNSSAFSPSTFTNAGYNLLPDSLLQYNGVSTGNQRWNNFINSVYLEKQMRNGEKINIDADYLYFTNKGRTAVQSSFIDKHGEQAGSNENLFSPGQDAFANTTIQVATGKIDYSKKMNDGLTLETGIKGTYTQSTSLSGIQSLVNGVWTSDPQTTNNIIMKEHVEAAYASMSWQINPSLLITPGIRYEYSYTGMNNSKTNDNITTRKLSSFFSSVFLSKKINDHSELQLSFTKRISRPSYNDLASYVGYSDPTAVYTGNPFLKPTITHNLKFGYSWKSYAFSILFSRDDNAIARYQLSESPAKNMLFISPQNLEWQNNITFQTTLPLKINKWWTMNYNFAGGLRQYRAEYTLQPFTHSFFGYSTNLNQNFKLTHGWSAELSGWYNGAGFNGTVRLKGFGALNAGLKKELKNNGGSFQFSITDILGTELYDIHYGTLTKEAFDIRSHVIVYPESTKFPIIKLTYSRSFGNNKAKTQRTAVSADEQERIRKE